MRIDRRRIGEDVAGKICGDDDFGAERARGRDRHRVHQCAVDQPAIADQDRREDAGQRVGGAHRVDHAAARQPDLVAGADLGRDGGELDRKSSIRVWPTASSSRVAELLAADQAGAVEADVEIAEDVAHALQAAAPFFQRVEPAGRIEAADHGADRGADHDVGHDAVGDQGSEDADMGKAARRAAAKREADDRPADATKADLLAVRAVRTPTLQDVQHRNSPTPGQPSPPE